MNVRLQAQALSSIFGSGAPTRAFGEDMFWKTTNKTSTWMENQNLNKFNEYNNDGDSAQEYVQYVITISAGIFPAKQ